MVRGHERVRKPDAHCVGREALHHLVHGVDDVFAPRVRSVARSLARREGSVDAGERRRRHLEARRQRVHLIARTQERGLSDVALLVSRRETRA